MKEVIQQLISELSTLTQPFNPIDLKKIFERHPLSQALSVPPELIQHLNQLTSLGKLIDLNFGMALKQHNLNIQQTNLENLITQEKEAQKNIHVFQSQMIQSAMLINSSFQDIMPLINEYLQKQNSLAPIFNVSADTKAKINAVEQYYKQISKIFREFDLPSAKIKVLQLKKTLDRLILELHDLKIHCSTDDSIHRYNSTILLIKNEINQLKEVQPIIIEFHLKFAQLISENDAKLKLQDITNLIIDTNRQLEEIQLEISINTLEILIKERLQAEFIEAHDKFALVMRYKYKIDNLLVYANPFAWKDWWQNSKRYDAEQTEHINSVIFLTLLTQEQALHAKIAVLEKQKNAIIDLPIGNLDSIDDDHDPDKLIAHTKKIFNHYIVLNKPDYLSTTCASDFYLILLANIPLIEQKLDQNNLALIKLGELININTELDRIRTKFELWVENDPEFPNETELLRQIEYLKHQDPARELLQNKLDLCHSFIENAKKFHLLVKQHIDALSNKKIIENKIINAKKNVLTKSQMDALSEQFANLQKDIIQSIEQIIHLPLSCEKITPIIEENKIISVQDNAVTQTDVLITEDLNTSLKKSITQQTYSHKNIAPPLKIPATEMTDNQGKTLTTSLAKTSHFEQPPILITQELIHINLINSDKLFSDPIPSKNIIEAQPNETIQNLYQLQSQEHNSPKQSNVLNTVNPQLLIEPQTTKEISNKIVIPTNNKSAHYSTLIMNDNVNYEQSHSIQISDMHDYVSNSNTDNHKDLQTSKLLTMPQLSHQKSLNLGSSDKHLKFSISKQDDDLQTRQYRHQKIQRLLQSQPQELQDWYQNIYSACDIYLLKNSNSFQTSYILKDILFELENKRDLNIIRAYMRLCPNPACSINNLIALKPNLPITEAPFDESKEIQDSPSELKPLYAQYSKLKKAYPIESELLLQAIRAVRTAKILTNMPDFKTTAKHFPSLLNDPRFIPLKRHRGFFKIWEALEDFFRLIIGKTFGQQEHEYLQKPCFFKTKSAELIEEADQMIQANLH